MLVHEITITEEDIEYAEKILLKEDQSFDEERRAFIKDFTTLDLQAVPGSGKTTVLLAKLLILEKYLPFDDGSGVLIISHTNTAVDEIKNRIGQYCPKLFSYPNFIGTIQSFVNKYLVIPFYKNHYEMKLQHIDTEIYESMLIAEFEKVKWNNPPKLGAWLYMQNGQDNVKVQKVIKNIYYDFESEEVKDVNTNNRLIRSENPKHVLLKNIILNVLLHGTISYDYAYKFANYYINDFSQIVNILRKRFSIVFIDEMQDMNKQQYDLLEKLFYENESTTIFQRIGDKNQAIYHGGDIETGTIWQDREKVLKLTGSNRLSSPIAQLVENFGIEYIEIEALQSHVEDLKPHILIYNDETIKDVIPRYSQLLKTYMEEEKIPKNSKNPFKVISWRKEHERHIALKNYFEKFEENQHKIKESYSNLKSYLAFFEDTNNNFSGIRKNIIKAFLHLLRLENKKDENDKYYTKSSLINFLKTIQDAEHNTVFNEFNIKLFQWCKLIVSENCIDDVYEDIKTYIPTFLEIFDVEINKSRTFVNDENIGTTPSQSTAFTEIRNIYNEDGFDIYISTVHSVKGETHASTLYLESFYQSKYESERHVDQFSFNRFTSDRKYDKQSVKIAYVGFSRPTHLLCIAIHKDRFDESINESGSFEIIELGS